MPMKIKMKPNIWNRTIKLLNGLNNKTNPPINNRIIQKYALLRAAVYIISGIAIALNPSAVFHFIGYLITAYLVLLGVLNLFEAYRFKRKTLQEPVFLLKR